MARTMASQPVVVPNPQLRWAKVPCHVLGRRQPASNTECLQRSVAGVLFQRRERGTGDRRSTGAGYVAVGHDARNKDIRKRL